MASWIVVWHPPPEGSTHTTPALTGELNKSSKKLAQPDMNSIAETGEVIIITRKNLDTINADTFQDYQAQWQQWIDKVNMDLMNLFNEISAELN